MPDYYVQELFKASQEQAQAKRALREGDPANAQDQRDHALRLARAEARYQRALKPLQDELMGHPTTRPRKSDEPK